MKLSARLIATAAFAIFLMPAFLLGAEEGAKPSAGAANDKAAGSSSSAAAPMPAASMQVASPYSRGPEIHTPKAELFLGYSYLRSVPTLEAGNRLMWLNGGSASIAFNFNRYLGIVAD